MKKSNAKKNNKQIYQSKHDFTPDRNYVYETIWQELK